MVDATMACIFMAVGVVVVAGGFLFAAINMVTAVRMTGHTRTAIGQFGRYGRMLRRHVAAMVIVAIGSLLVTIGLISGAYLALAAFFAPYGF